MADKLNGEFILAKRLGGGAEGEVYEGVSSATHRKVAIKIIRQAQEHPELLDRLKKLKGSAIASCPALLDVFEHDGKIVTVHEFLDGVPLRAAIQPDAASPQKRRQLADALITAVRGLHAEGHLHGDLSPDNVFVSDEAVIKLIDPRISIKRGGGVLGTPNYAAPEMLQFGSSPTPSADVFSLAALLYDIFEGRPPFGCRSAEEYVLKAGSKSLPIGKFENTPEDFRLLIRAGLTLDPGERPQSVEGLIALRRDEGQRRRLIAVGAVVIAGLLLAVGWRLRASRAAIDSIAVLPLVNESRDADTDYLSEGMTESIINELAQLPKLRVCPRNTVFRYRKDVHDASRVAHDLDVRAIVTGRLMRRGDALSVSVELLDAKDNKQLWGARYDRKITDALAMQQEISRKMFEVLRTKINGASQRRLSKRGTDNPDAYQAYLKGRYYWNRRTVANIGKALEQFQKAVDADPVYALAYIGLADSYAVLPQYAGVASAETRPKARAAAMRALEIDDSLAEAHASMGYIDMMSWRFKEAESDFGRALALDPNYSTGHQWYGIFLHVIGRREKALVESLHAQQLDPLSPIITVQVCNLLLLNDRLTEGIDECRKTLELDEKFPRAHDLLGWAYLRQGKNSAAISEFNKAATASGRASQELSYLGYGYGILKRRAEAMSVLKELERLYAERRSPAMYLAAVYAGLGDKDQAFAWLEKDFKAQNGALVYMTYFPIYDTLRDDPRYPDLARRIGL